MLSRRYKSLKGVLLWYEAKDLSFPLYIYRRQLLVLLLRSPFSLSSSLIRSDILYGSSTLPFLASHEQTLISQVDDTSTHFPLVIYIP